MEWRPGCGAHFSFAFLRSFNLVGKAPCFGIGHHLMNFAVGPKRAGLERNLGLRLRFSSPTSLIFSLLGLLAPSGNRDSGYEQDQATPAREFGRCKRPESGDRVRFGDTCASPMRRIILAAFSLNYFCFVGLGPTGNLDNP